MHRVSSALSLAYRGPRLPAPSPGREHAARSGAVVVPVWFGAFGASSRGGGGRGPARRGTPLPPLSSGPPPRAGRRAIRERKGGSLAVSRETAHRPPSWAPCLPPPRAALSRASPSLPLLATRTRRACRVRVLLLVLCRLSGSPRFLLPGSVPTVGERPVTSVPPRGRGIIRVCGGC